MEVYIVIYVLLLNTVILEFILKREIKYISIFFSTIFILLEGFRYNVGIDYIGYMNYFYYNKLLDIRELEFLYRILNQIFKIFRFEFYSITLFFSIINQSLIYYFSKEFKISKNLLLLLYLINLNMFISFNLIRQSYACIFLTMAIYIFKKNKVKGVLFNICAYLFHTTTILYLPISFFKKKILVKYYLILIILAIYFDKIYFEFIFILEKVIPYRYLSYIKYIERFRLNSKISIIMIIQIIVSILILKKISSRKINTKYVPVINIFCINSLIVIFFRNFSVLDRISYYSSYFIVLIYASLPRIFPKKKEKSIIIVIIILLSLSYFKVILNDDFLYTQKLNYQIWRLF